jgi:hypothetical protein
MKVRNKAEMYQRLFKGEFGNKNMTWATLEELEASGYKGELGIRSSYVGGRVDMVMAHDARRVAEGRPDFPFMVSYSERLPDDRLTFQGEVQRSERWYDLTYSHQKVWMREALKSPLYASGLKALSLLQYYMDPSSYSDLMVLFDQYPDSVIEFACFDCDIGIIPHRNTVIWEVRNY